MVRLLDDLKPADAEILRLTAWEELDTTEIAIVLDISPDAASQRVSRARRRFSDMYEEKYEKRSVIPSPAAQEGGVW